jgi:hypothetical protein
MQHQSTRGKARSQGACAQLFILKVEYGPSETSSAQGRSTSIGRFLKSIIGMAPGDMAENY